jgi:hypothetical protein
MRVKWPAHRTLNGREIVRHTSTRFRNTDRQSVNTTHQNQNYVSELQKNLEVRHARCVGSITKNFVYYMYSQTTVIHLSLQ